MRLFAIVASALLAMACTDAQQNKTTKPLPFDGRFQSLTLDNLEETYMLHILKQRSNGASSDPADYLEIDQKGRTPAYNGDTGVISVAVDDKAIFNNVNNIRRSDVVQQVAGNPKGTTFFRASIRAEETIQNKYQWQAFFPESHVWDVYVDVNQSTPKLQFLADNWALQYETEFKYKTWMNVGIAVEASGLITFYASEADAPLQAVYTTKKALAADKIPADYELHFGMLVYSPTPNPPMVKDHQDELQFSGITVDTKAPDGVETGNDDDDDNDNDNDTASDATTRAKTATSKPSGKCKTSRRK